MGCITIDMVFVNAFAIFASVPETLQCHSNSNFLACLSAVDLKLVNTLNDAPAWQFAVALGAGICFDPQPDQVFHHRHHSHQRHLEAITISISTIKLLVFCNGISYINVTNEWSH
jgi:hypothetical protein